MAKKPNTLEAKVAAQAASVDRDAIMDALVRAVAKTAPRPASDESSRYKPTMPMSASSQQERGIPKRKRASFSRVGFRRYDVLRVSAALNHKRGTWTRFMVSTIISHEDTRAATKAHQESGQYPEKTLDFNWSVNQGYIAYKV